MILNETQFEKLADSISEDFLKTGTPLEDGILKVAHEAHLNPDQIRQLARITNVRTHLELFEKSSADNKIVEFPVADPDKILEKFYGEPVKTASFDDAILDFGTPLADNRPLEKTAGDILQCGACGSHLNRLDLKNHVFGKGNTLTCGACKTELHEDGAEKFKTAEAYATVSFENSKNRLAVRKIASELEGKLLEAKEVYKLGITKLATELRKYNEDAASKLADIHAVLGKEAECVIIDVSTTARLAKPVGLVKTAAIIDDTDPIFKVARSVNDAYRACIKLAIANTQLHKKLKENGLE
jgi:hypothetical protein